MNHKSIAVFSIVLWTIIALFFGSIFAYLLINRPSIACFIPKQFCSETVIASNSFQADEVKTIDISFRAGTVEFTPSESSVINVTQTSFYEVTPIDMQLNNGILDIRETSFKRNGFFVLLKNPSILKIEIPSKHFDAIHLNMTSGECTGNDLACDNLNITITSGEVVLTGFFKNIYTKQTSGDIEITSNAVPTTVDTKMTSGEMTLTIPDNDGFVATINKSSGSIGSTFAFTVNHDNKNNYVYKSDQTGRHYHVDMTSGNFQLYKIQQ